MISVFALMRLACSPFCGRLIGIFGERLVLAAGDAAYGEALEHALTHDAWDADRRAALAAARLGLDGLAPDRAVGGGG